MMKVSFLVYNVYSIAKIIKILIFPTKNPTLSRFKEEKAWRKFLDGRKAISLLDSSHRENANFLLVGHCAGFFQFRGCRCRALWSTAIPYGFFVYVFFGVKMSEHMTEICLIIENCVFFSLVKQGTRNTSSLDCLCPKCALKYTRLDLQNTLNRHSIASIALWYSVHCLKLFGHISNKPHLVCLFYVPCDFCAYSK